MKKNFLPEQMPNSELLPIDATSSPNCTKPNVVCSQSPHNRYCNQKQIEIGKNESPSDYGSSANVVFVRNGRYYIDNPNYRSQIAPIAIYISIATLLIQLLLIARLLLR